MSRTLGYYDRRAPFVDITVIEIAVPSGRLIVSDDLRSTPHFDINPPSSINYGAGLDAWTRVFAQRAQVAQAFVGNSCPTITRQLDGTLIVVTPDYDEETGQNTLVKDEVPVATVCTDVWSVMLTDYAHWLSHDGPAVDTSNGPFSLEKFSLIDVTRGLYRWTVFSNSDRFDLNKGGRTEYAWLELIQAY